MEKCVRVAALERFSGIQTGGLRTGQRFTIRNRTRGGTVAVDAIGPGAENSNAFSCNALDTGEYERGISAAYAVSGHRRTDLSVGDQRHAPLGIVSAQVFELGKQIFSGPLYGPIVGRIIAAGYASQGLRGAVGGVKQVIQAEHQLKMGLAESRITGFR